jgi:hypothetical protein
MIGGSPYSNKTLTAHDLKRIALALGGRPNGSGWRARCPAHEGADRNLSLWVQDDHLGLKCWSHSCSRRDILYSIIDRGYAASQRPARQGVGQRRAQTVPSRPPTWLTTNERVTRHRHHPASTTRVVADTVASFTDITPHSGENFDLQRRGRTLPSPGCRPPANVAAAALIAIAVCRSARTPQHPELHRRTAGPWSAAPFH